MAKQFFGLRLEPVEVRRLNKLANHLNKRPSAVLREILIQHLDRKDLANRASNSA